MVSLLAPLGLFLLLVVAGGCHQQWARRPRWLPQDAMVDVVNKIGIELLAIHNENNDNNIAISPYGAASVLVALGEGVQGEAAYEINKATHIPQDISLVRVGMRDIHRHLKSYFIPEEGFLAGLTLSHDNVTLNREYEDILRFYGYDIESFNSALYPELYTTQNPLGTLFDSEVTTTINPSVTVEDRNGDTTTIVATTETERVIRSDGTTIATTTVPLSTTLEITTITTTNQPELDTTTKEPEIISTEVVESTTTKVTTTEPSTTNIAMTELLSNTVSTTEEPEVTTRVLEGTTKVVPDSTTTGEPEVTTRALESTTTTTEEPTTTVEVTTIVTSTTPESTSTEVPSTTTSTTTTESIIETTLETTTVTTTVVAETTTEPTTTTTDGPVPSTTVTEPTTTESLVEVFDVSALGDTARSSNILPEKLILEPNGTSFIPKKVSTNEVLKPLKRNVRSVLDYVIARYYDDHSITQKPPSLPDDQLTFLINGQHRESNINFMTYDTVLPFAYIPHLNSLALRFPLDSTRYYLLLLLPLQDDGIDQLICDLRRETSLRYIIKGLRYHHVKAIIPSFMLKGYVILTPTFQKMGVKKVFEPRQADFSPMTSDRDIYVTNIEQAITVNIRNYVDPSTANNFRYMHQYDPVLFKADHPFLYFVIDSDIQVTLMEGKIVNPLNSRIR